MLEDYSRLKQEFDRLKSAELPTISEDMDAVLVLSGPQLTWDAVGEGGVNQTKNRMLTGFSIAKEVAGLRSGKLISELSLDEISRYAPAVIFNGWNEQNMHLAELRSNGFFDKKYGFPANKLLICLEQDKVFNTKDQLADILPDYFSGNRRTVLVSDGYHLPRVRRYLMLDGSPIDASKTILYPAQPMYMPDDGPESLVRIEIQKILTYSAQGDLPRF